MTGKNGGARPGAGRKRKATIDEQISRRDVVLDVVSDSTWRDHVQSLVAQSERGNYAALLPLYPYILGSAKQEINVTGTVEHRLTIETIRQAIGIAEIKALPDPQKQAG